MALDAYRKVTDRIIMDKRLQHQDSYEIPKGHKKQAEPFQNSSSPLLLMQKNYQRRLLEEKEKKLAELYRNQQETSMREISKKSSKQVKQYFQRTNSDIQRDSASSGNSDRTKRLPPIDQQTKKSRSFHEDTPQLHVQRTIQRPLRQTYRKPTSTTKQNILTQDHHVKIHSVSEKENTNSSVPDLASLKSLKRIQVKKQQQLQKLNKRHQDHGPPQNETRVPKEELTDFQKWQMAQDMERQMRLNRYNQINAENSGLLIPVDVSTTEIDCEPFSFKPKLHQSDAFQKLDHTRDVAGKKKKRPKPNRLEILRHRIATPDSMDDSSPVNGLMSNGDQHMGSSENLKLDQTYSKQLGMSEQMRIYQNNLKVKESRQKDVMAGFQKPVLVRRDTRSTTSSRTSTRNTFSPQVMPVSSSDGSRYQQNWKGQQQTQETSRGADRLVIHDQTNSQEQISEYEEVQLMPCNICGRKFRTERLSQHKVVCSKTAGKKRKVFNMANARKKGTDLEGFSAVKGFSRNAPSAHKSSWRSKHEDFINTIRHAKQISAYVAEGGKITDLPPPPPSINPDYVQCQYCERRFAPKVAERHIPKCKETKSRPPPPKKRQSNRKR